jgi:hypothetical protein
MASAVIKFSKRDTKVEEPNAYQDTEGWVSPRGKFYPLDGAHSHGQWVVSNYDWLTTMAGAKLPPKKDLVKDVISRGSDYVRNLLVGQGWLHVYNPKTISVRSLASQNSAVTDYILTSGNGYSDFDVIEVYSLDTDRWTKKTYKQWKGVDDDEGGFSSYKTQLNVEAGTGGWKAWANPESNTLNTWRVGSSGGPHHTQKLPEDVDDEVGNQDDFEAQWGENAVIEHANTLGWYQVAIDNGYLYITAFDDETVGYIIEMLPSDVLATIKEIITDAGSAQVEKGQDVIKAWRMRNSIRNKIRASVVLSSRDAVKDTIEYWDKAKNKDFSKYWRKLKKKKKKASLGVKISSRNYKAWAKPSTGEIITWDINGSASPHHIDKIPDTPEVNKLIEDARERGEYNTGEPKKEITLTLLERDGWYKIAYFDGYLNIGARNQEDISKIFKMVPTEFLFTPSFFTHTEQVEVNYPEETADEAWYKHIRKKAANMQLSYREASLGDFGKNKRWRANLSLYDIIKKYETNPENYQNVSYKIFKRIMRNVDGYKFLLKDKKERLKAMAQEFCDLKDKKFKNRKEFEAAFNILFEKLYKFADKNKIWIG